MKIKLLTYLLFIVGFISAQTPTATIGALTNTICTERNVTFTSSVNNAPTTYSWSVVPASAVNFNGAVNEPSLTLQFTKPGTAIITLLVANSSSFSATSQTLIATKSAKSSFNASLTTAGFPTELTLTNYSSNQTGTEWLFNNFLPDNSLNTTKTYTIGGAYSTTLVALGNFGCNDTSSYNFVIDDFSSIVLPNIFTPNEDGANDVYKPLLKGIKEIDVVIYNRYGTLIHSWNRVGGKWDGYTTSGVKCSAGTYFIILTAKGFDGKNYNMKNTITLIE